MRVRRWAALVVLCLVVGLFLLLGPVRLHQAQAAGAEEQRLLELINGYRQENGLGPLVPSGALYSSAERHSEDMAAHDFFSHSTRESAYYPGGSGPAERAAWEGYPTNVYTGENIALGQQTAEEVFEAWRGSPEHNAAMLGEQYTAAGIGYVDSYWTADFGSVADVSSYLESLEPYAGQVVDPATGKQTSTPRSSEEQEDDKQTPEEQAQPEETLSKLRTTAEENEWTTSEGALVEQTSTPQETVTEQGVATPPTFTGEEAAPGTTSSTQSPTGGTAAEQYAPGPGPVEVVSGQDDELAAGSLNVETPTQEVVTERGLPSAYPMRTEAMETALAAREAVPEDLAWQVPFAAEQPSEEPAATQSPTPSGLGASDDGPTSIIPVAKKKPPAPEDASPLTLFVGAFLLLCGFLVYGTTTRKQRGS